jgi:small neutral amino acid transporter SnatA (MarC family)
MAKKKKHKKRNFTHGNQTPVKSGTSPSADTPVPSATKPSRVPAMAAPASIADPHELTHLAQIKSDIRKVAVLAASFVVFQIIWYLFEHTALGTHIYSLVKI